MRLTIRFAKYQGCGNDFIIVDERKKTTLARTRSRLAMKLCDRNYQIGADGLIFLERTDKADVSMRLYEPAGNEADMCGNGIRCVAAYIGDKHGRRTVDVLTRDGVKRIVKARTGYVVDMGPVRTTRRDLRRYIKGSGNAEDSMLAIEILAGNTKLRGSLVNSGEPHFVARVRDLDGMDVRRTGDAVNGDTERFPRGVNLNFVTVLGPHEIRIRTYERGVYDETLACGTGATASAAVALMLGWVKPGRVRVRTKGGDLSVEMGQDGRALLTGPAVHVFDGTIAVDL